MSKGIYVRTGRTKNILVESAKKGWQTRRNSNWVCPLQGRKYSKNHREKISKSHENIERSQDTKCKIRETLKKYYIQNPDRLVELRNTAIKQHQEKTNYCNTSIERKVKGQLSRMNVRFVQQYAIDNKFICDFFIPDLNLLIECDGTYWHSFLSRIEGDKLKDNYVKEKGYNMLRLPENVINEKGFEIVNYLKMERN